MHNLWFLGCEDNDREPAKAIAHLVFDSMRRSFVFGYLFQSQIEFVTVRPCKKTVAVATLPFPDCRCTFAPMIAFLTGTFALKTPSYIHINVGGVGYEVQISLNTYSRIQDQEKGTLLTHLIVREDAHILFGFADAAEKEMFLHLISITGIGSNTARVMLSYMKPEELSRAIIQGNARQLEAVKGIGRKTAERIVIELRDKLAKQPIESDPNISVPQGNSFHNDALNALVALGINRQAADVALKKALEKEPNAGVELLIKRALQLL
jgi:Holliday junction DNA helicase RuvA